MLCPTLTRITRPTSPHWRAPALASTAASTGDSLSDDAREYFQTFYQKAGQQNCVLDAERPAPFVDSWQVDLITHIKMRHKIPLYSRYTYTSDLRYEASHAQHSADWGLVLRWVGNTNNGEQALRRIL